MISKKQYKNIVSDLDCLQEFKELNVTPVKDLIDSYLSTSNSGRYQYLFYISTICDFDTTYSNIRRLEEFINKCDELKNELGVNPRYSDTETFKYYAIECYKLMPNTKDSKCNNISANKNFYEIIRITVTFVLLLFSGFVLCKEDVPNIIALVFSVCVVLINLVHSICTKRNVTKHNNKSVDSTREE